jgi:hypothetical protein
MAKTKHNVKTWAEQQAYEAIHGRYVGRKEWIISLAETGLHKKACSRLVGVANISNWAAPYDVEFAKYVPPKRPSRIPTAPVGELARQGRKQKEIAHLLGISTFSVSKIMSKHFPDLQRKKKRCSPSSEKPAPVTPVTPVAQPKNPVTMAELAAQENVARRQVDRGLWR